MGTKLDPMDADKNPLPLVDSPLDRHPTKEESSWIAALVALGALIGKCSDEIFRPGL